MTDREKLIELIRQGKDMTPCEKDNDYRCEGIKCADCESKSIADYLLANGVFILPEDLRGTEDFSISAFIEAMQMYKEKDRYIKLPCKVGDKLYCVTNLTHSIAETVVIGMWIADGTFSILTIHGVIVDGSIGKTVFLTKSQAEEALKNEQEKL